MFTDAEMRAAWLHWSPTSNPGKKGKKSGWRSGPSAWKTATSARASSQDVTRAQLSRIVNRSPQVMVKVTGVKKGGIHLFSHFTYMSRNSKLEFADQDGRIYRSNRELKELAEDWTFENDYLETGRRRDNAIDARALVFSMPAGTSPTVVRNATAAAVRGHFDDNFDYVMALHTDTPRPHVHVTVRSTGYDGRKLSFSPVDLHSLRERFAHELRIRDVPADATPKISRGPVERRESRPTYWARKRAS